MKLRPCFSLVFLIGLVCGNLTLQLARCAEPSPNFLAGAGSHPNVLFLAIDDLNDWIGATGSHPQAKTPNLDRLIKKSILFGNAHCAAPVCSASRHAALKRAATFNHGLAHERVEG